MNRRNLFLFGVIALMTIGFALASEPFRDPANFLDRTRLWSEVGLVAIPMTFVITAAGIDLSVGSLVALAAMAGAATYVRGGWPFPVAVAVTLLTGIVGGLVNGLTVYAGRIPSLVVTIATLAMFRGLAMGIGHGQPITGFPEGFTDWGAGSRIAGIPQTLAILIVAFGAGEVALRFTRFGRWTELMGENSVAARFAGIAVDRMWLGLFGISGAFCGLAALTYMARFANAHPADNAGLELQAIAAVVIGGTRITGGRGSLIGTGLGVLFLGILGFGLEMVGVPQQTQTMVVGALVILVALANEALANRPRRDFARVKTRQ